MVALDELFLAGPELPQSFSMLRQLRKHGALCVLTIRANSWATSFRHEEQHKLPCLFGCEALACDSGDAECTMKKYYYLTIK